MLDTEQISRLSAGHTAHEHILEMIDSGQNIDSIRRHCIIMKGAAESQLKLLLKAEKEIVVSDSPDAKHVDLHDVRNLECEADNTPVVENTSGAALETRIDSEKVCNHDWIMIKPSCGTRLSIWQCGKCGKT